MAEKIQFTIEFDIDLDQYLESHFHDVVDYHILSKALDARGANCGKKPRYTYNLDTIKEGERFARKNEVFKDLGPLKSKPIMPVSTMYIRRDLPCISLLLQTWLILLRRSQKEIN